MSLLLSGAYVDNAACLQTVARKNASSSALMKVASAVNRENEGGNNDIFDAKEQVLLGLKAI